MLFVLVNILQGFFLFGHIAGGNSFPKPLTPEEEQKYLLAYASGCDDAKNILIERNLRLVAHVTKKYNAHAKDTEDLISIGTIGLIKAVASFKPDKNVRLATYAARCIENEILMDMRAGKKRSYDIHLQDVIGVDREGNEVRVEDKLADNKDPVDDQVGLKMQVAKLKKVLLHALQGREKDVIKMRYGLEGAEELTQREIAKKLDISRSYVSRIEKRALNKLESHLEEGASGSCNKHKAVVQV